MANILKYWDNGVLKSVTTGGGNGGTFDHNELTEESRAMPNQHPINSITGLQDELSAFELFQKTTTEELNKKINSPIISGAMNQFLVSDGIGGTMWRTVYDAEAVKY